MYNRIKFDRVFYFLFVTITTIGACKKSDALSSDSSALLSSDFIAVAAGVAASGVTTDSIYLVQPCGKGSSRDSISQSSLPNVTAYLQSNYPSYQFSKAFSITDSEDNTAGYVIVIVYNEKPVGLLFDNTGSFVKTLEQREKSDLNGKGWHHGGRFGERGGAQKDTISLGNLPSSVLSFLQTNYTTDTLLKAFSNRDSSMLVITTNNGLYATIFDASGNFIKRSALAGKTGKCTNIEESGLPAVTRTYLESTYPNYVFKKAYTISSGGLLQGYVVIIDANNIKYALNFDATGNFVNVKTIW